MPYESIFTQRVEQVVADEGDSLIERHVEEGVLKRPGLTHEQPFVIRCIKGCARFGAFVIHRVCGVLARSHQGERRFDVVDGARSLAFLAVLAVHVDEVSALRFPDTYGDSSWRTKLHSGQGGLWDVPLRVVVLGGNYWLGVYLVISGFLCSFVLFLRSGPLLQQPYSSERERLGAFGWLSVNFMAGRWARVWPILQCGVFLTWVWGSFLTIGSSTNQAVASELLPWCEGARVWSEVLMLSNFVENPCFGDLWSVALTFQL